MCLNRNFVEQHHPSVPSAHSQDSSLSRPQLPRRFFMRNSISAGFVLLFTVVVLASLASAQSAASATITGRVTDPQGAVVANTNVTATNTATGITRRAQTTSDGLYTIPNLPPGTYEVSAQAASFSKAVSSGLMLQVGEARDINFALKVGSATTVLEVTQEAPLIETTKTDVSTVVTSTDIEKLPVFQGF